MTEAEGHRVLIVGCGQLGSRHLQAVATIPQVVNIDVVDPQPVALALGRQRLEEMPGRHAHTQIQWLSSLQEAYPGGDLCIVATRAEGRSQVVREVVQNLGYRSFLLEKIVAQSILEMEELSAFSESKQINVWVNCQARAYPLHQRIKARLDPDEPVILNVAGGNHGLATNGIHHADLFAFYDGTERIKSAGSRIDPIAHPSKRGAGLMDLSGTLHGYTDKGSTLTVSYASQFANYEHTTISTPQYRCIVDHLQRWALESDAVSQWGWQPASFPPEVLVSQITKVFAGDILSTGSCALPTLKDSLVAHRFILGELQPHFNQILERESDRCPVT